MIAGEPPYLMGSQDDYDGLLMPFADFINALGESQEAVVGISNQGEGVRMSITELQFDLSLELRVRENKTGSLTLHSSPVTQTLETTVFPVLHRIQIHYVRTEADIDPTARRGTNDE